MQVIGVDQVDASDAQATTIPHDTKADLKAAAREPATDGEAAGDAAATAGAENVDDSKLDDLEPEKKTDDDSAVDKGPSVDTDGSFTIIFRR